MENFHKKTGNAQKVVQIAGILLKTIGFFFIASAISAMLMQAIGLEISDIASLPNIPNVKLKLALAQGLGAIAGFIILPLLYILFLKPTLIDEISILKKISPISLVTSIAILFCAFPLIAFISGWNKNIHLPDSMQQLEQNLRNLEAKAEVLTNLLVNYNNATEFIILFVVIAIIPAVGEELLFRGIVQNELKQTFNNPHLAIWVAGFIFSFIHFQFLGFVPRMLLGVLFGYLYFWSGKILIPMLLHLLNNGITFILMGMHAKGSLQFDIEDEKNVPILLTFIAALLMGWLLNAFKKYSRQNTYTVE